nr:MAG TPA: hypothetical protein [Caudoviricetes sp.]
MVKLTFVQANWIVHPRSWVTRNTNLALVC